MKIQNIELVLHPLRLLEQLNLRGQKVPDPGARPMALGQTGSNLAREIESRLANDVALWPSATSFAVRNETTRPVQLLNFRRIFLNETLGRIIVIKNGCIADDGTRDDLADRAVPYLDLPRFGAEPLADVSVSTQKSAKLTGYSFVYEGADH